MSQEALYSSYNLSNYQCNKVEQLFQSRKITLLLHAIKQCVQSLLQRPSTKTNLIISVLSKLLLPIFVYYNRSNKLSARQRCKINYPYGYDFGYGEGEL